MRYRKEVFTAVGTIGCAICVGFFMQNSQSAHTLYGEGGAAAKGERLINADAAVLDVDEIILTSGNLANSITPPAPESTVVLAAASAPTAPVAPVEMDVAQELPDQTAQADDPLADAPMADDTLADLSCDIVADARPMAAAMVQLSLDAPCMANERVTVMHSGLLFHELTDESGQLALSMPALVQDAMFVFAFSNGEGAVAQTEVEEIGSFDRVAVQWKGDTGFELHAREFGANYGDVGHVWSGAMRDMTYAVTGEGGYISRLGSAEIVDGLVAEVYTFPTNLSQTAGEIALSVETEVAANNCGLEIEAQTIQTDDTNDVISRDLTLSVPDCDAAGNFLVLNNLFEDLKVASN